MRPFFIAAAIAFLLCCPIFASVEHDRAAEALISRMLLYNETFAYKNFSEDGIILYYLVSIDGTERFMVRSGPLPLEGKGQAVIGAEPVLEASAASEVLKKISEQNGSDLSELDKLDSIHQLVRQFESSRTPGEHKCDILIGMDEHQCIDFDSCQKSCYSRTSFCQPLAIGIGRPLIEAMLGYSNGTKNLTLLLDGENASYAALSSNRTVQNLEGYLSLLTVINMQATKVNNNPLFYDYQMCFPPGYDMASLTRAKLEMLSIRAKAMPILRAQEQGREMAEFAKARFNALPNEIPGVQANMSNGTNVSINASENQTTANGIPNTSGIPSNAMASEPVTAGDQSPLILASAALAFAVLAAAYFHTAKKKGKVAKQETPKKK